MKIGYPCINLSLQCRPSRTFRLRNYSENRLRETVENNLSCLETILEYNKDHGIRFFRITSDIIPFASHEVNTFAWQEYFRKGFRKIGVFIKRHGIRVSMHPDQFTLINSRDPLIFRRSLRELQYHVSMFDLMHVPHSAKVQIHVGGVYNDKQKSIARFIKRYKKLDNAIRRRLVIENDERSYSLFDCMLIHDAVGIPVVFDTLHHRLNNNGETIAQAMRLATKTWRRSDGLPIVDYSTQQPGSVLGKHAEAINMRHFRVFLDQTQAYDFDIMLEIKDKEKSARRALKIAARDKRLRAMADI
jgi:UV DNA damage endonuclease